MTLATAWDGIFVLIFSFVFVGGVCLPADAQVVVASPTAFAPPVIWTPMANPMASLPRPPEIAYIPSALAPEGDVLPPETLTLPSVSHRLIDQALAYYLGPGRTWVQNAFDRSRPYRDFIRQRLEEEGLPQEFFWLAAVESGFNAGATSRTGAAGLWQFMKNSVGGYDMSINPYVDERRDFWKSTDGAIHKLKYNYQRLGSWYLALAAYNAGVGRIESIVRRAKGEKDYWKLLDQGVLPRETAGYVPQLLALAKISAHWDEYGFTADWEPSPSWERIQIDRMVDLRLLAEAAGISEDELRAANKELIYHLTPVLPGGYNLKVKAAWVEPLKQALDDPSLKLIRFYLYAVQKGDTLSEIAQWYGVSTAMIERDNPGLKPAFLRIGQNLVIAALKDVGPYRSGAPRG